MTGTPTVPDNGFDIYMTKGVDHIVNLTPPPPSDDDDDEIPVYTPRWNDVQLDISGGEPELNGYRFQMQYWVSNENVTVDPESGEESTTYTKTFPAWTVVSQTITKSSPARQVFFTNTGNELFPIPAGSTGSLIGNGGITDGTKYSYLLVFNEAELEWLPRVSTPRQPFITKKTPPDGIINPDLPYPKYTMDTLSAFVPDPRESVTISYQVTTTYRIGIGEGAPTGTHTFTIEQKCVQDFENVGEKLQALLDKCYFTHGFYHMQLYETEAPPNYDEYGDPIPLLDENGNPVLDENGDPVPENVIEPIYLLDEDATELVGFDVFELQNTVWIYNEIDKVPEYEAASEIVLEETVAEGQEQIKDYKDLMATTQKEYEAEIASIEKVQQENAGVISVNEERKTKLLGNIKNMITGNTSLTESSSEETTTEGYS